MKENGPILLILAAGMGSRYGGLKQLDTVGPSGETILDYSIYDALATGFTKIVFVIRRDIETAFKATVGARYESMVEVDYVYQELDALPDGFSPLEGRAKPWGTGHAILMACGVVDRPFGVINADDFYGRDAYQQLAAFLSKSQAENVHAMVGYKLSNTLSENGTVSRGICRRDGEGNLGGVEEVTAIAKGGDGIRGGDRQFSGEEIVSMNLWGFQPSIFAALREQFTAFLRAHGAEEKSEFYIPFAVDEEIQAKRASVKVLPTESQWAGVTYREDKPLVEAFIRTLIGAGRYPQNLFNPHGSPLS
ncbi:MAG: nucleotidyltransferase [Verrucomicrobia bacterium]|jgi:UTP-glucose-1-phosphate uridylyltransferase|nr:nucleotidyltransferase [Verrucomicrobiota bacterium]